MTAPWFASDLEQRNVTLKQEKVAVEQEKDALKQEKDALKQEKDALKQENDALQHALTVQHALTDVQRRLQSSMYLVARLQKLVASNRAMRSHTTSLFCYTVYAFIRRVTGGCWCVQVPKWDLRLAPHIVFLSKFCCKRVKPLFVNFFFAGNVLTY